MKVWVGTSGYSYPAWVGPFYPPGTQQKNMLSQYARVFPITELNFTYYGLPTPQVLERQAKQTPPGFQFAVKLFQGLTHDRDLSHVPAFREAVSVLQQHGKLCALLAQFPQQFHWRPETLSFLARLADELRGFPLAIEFRHHTWARSDVTDWLRANGLHLVSVDAPALPALFPSGLVWSSRLAYIRLHSRRADRWYEGDKERYDYLYSDAEMKEWVEALRARRGDVDEAYVLFNNCHEAQAPINAKRLQELLANDRDLTLVPPFEAQADQGTLF